MSNNIIDLEQLSLEQLKAMAYDLLRQQQIVRNNLVKVQEMIERKTKALSEQQE